MLSYLREDRVIAWVTVVPEHFVGLEVGLSHLEFILIPACLSKVGDTGLIHREEADSSSVLWTHVRNGGSVCDGQLGHAGTKELHKLTHHSDLTQMLQ